MGIFKNIKGFLGPIGDDLPSLIPLLFGLAIFFSSFTFAYQAFDAENANFKYAIKSMDLAKTVKSDSFISGYADFRTSCNNISVSGISYKVLLFRDFIKIKEDSASSTNPLSMDTHGIVTGDVLNEINPDNTLIKADEATELKEEGDEFYPYFICSNVSKDGLATVGKIKKFDVRLFPVAYLNKANNSSTDVAVLMVITWS